MSETERREPLYKQIATAIDARARCKESVEAFAAGKSMEHESVLPLRKEWFDRWTARLATMADYLPHGAGFDCGTKIDLERSTAEKLVFFTEFHNMDDNGSYAGWTSYVVKVRASLIFTLTLTITGGSSDDKDFVHESFDLALRESYPIDRFVSAEERAG